MGKFLTLFSFCIRYLEGIKEDLKDETKYKENENKLKEYGVIIPSMPVIEKNENVEIVYDDDIFKQFQKECGIYLYLLLLNKGFPASRMVILTGNETYAKGLLEQNHISTNVIIGKEADNPNIENSNSTEIESKYYGENSSFYTVRRLVFSAVEYWTKKLADKKEDEIAFNKLYFKSGEKYTINSFITLMNEVKRLFENMVPSDAEKLYYNAMHIFAGFHEEKAKINNISNGKPALYPYHSMIRFFRNWSSHNLFKYNKLSADDFALLFCIALVQPEK